MPGIKTINKQYQVKEGYYNYSTQKDSWVKYNSNKPKVKLRKYIKNLVNEFSRYDEIKRSDKLKMFIDGYNEAGLQGLRKVYGYILEKQLAYVQQQINDICVESNDVSNEIKELTSESRKYLDENKIKD